jgi:hypothetical protein
MDASREKHVQKRQEQNKIVRNQRKPVKSEENTQKTFKTLENEWKPRNTPVGAMEQANNTHRHSNQTKKHNSKKKTILEPKCIAARLPDPTFGIPCSCGRKHCTVSDS